VLRSIVAVSTAEVLSDNERFPHEDFLNQEAVVDGVYVERLFLLSLNLVGQHREHGESLELFELVDVHHGVREHLVKGHLFDQHFSSFGRSSLYY